ncbi:dihydrolipoamide acetyltransferase family protein [Melittangium boletus]|uniref:Dihydrolipoamide acetyltransferase component of pyruvate dehydrogenase complex n=1 Tax=Melittangium boletus DSM 14713 TaxID=1294270 RepID=A0A250ILT0_9BACT|nr:dihydrolipoamide acetyltransferase family protein [Melittangium boletus]ATB32714.1 dihydrolipoamide acyltransferase [Melittangium boletus DSM 14713]
MAIFELKLPDLGEGVQEGELVKWHVKPGDQVQEDQTLAEVMTDKATVTVPSPKAGRVVQTHGKEGEMAKVHQLLVTLEIEGAAPAQAAGHGAPAAAPVSAAAEASAASSSSSSSSKVLATPLTRRMAREHGLDLSQIAGSGPQGRVMKADVTAALEGASATRNEVTPPPAAAPSRPAAPPVAAGRADERIPLRGLRKKIAEKMVRSKFTAPHFGFVEETDATELVALRKRLNESLAATGDKTKLSFLPFIVKAVIAAMKKYPHLNAHMDEAAQELVVRGEFNIGIAVATPEGLTVPVLKNADRLTLRELADEVVRLSTAARERKLKMDELTGGSFTITSLGQTGGIFATPIINHPEVAILGIHRMRKRPVVDKNDQIVVREMMNISISADHRVIDGQVAADFVYEVIKYLEHPDMLFLAMA